MMSGFLGLLDLKKDATIGLDGQTILLRTDDFVGVSGLDQGFHLASVRPQANSSISVGFLIVDNNSPLIRRYDPQTEEVSSQPVDSLTATNLLDQVRNQQLPQTSVIEYSKIVPGDQEQQWKDQTKFITESGILGKRGLKHGDKIIPGSCQDEDAANLTLSNKTTVDGKSMAYPSIPVVDTTISLRTNRHAGAKRHLSGLSPSERTQLFMEPRIASRLLYDVLAMHYDGKWKALLADLQLAYILFLYLQCLASLEHWKDLVAMLSLVEPLGMQEHAQLYQSLVEILPSQLASMDTGFLDDVDEAGNNFLLPSLHTLCQHLSRTSGVVDEQSLVQFERVLSNKFPTLLVVNEESADIVDHDQKMKYMEDDDDSGSHDDDSDAPVVVDMAEVEASLARTSKDIGSVRYAQQPFAVQRAYPLLVAAILPHEDILMTCARALDEKKDVSLVREAAAYLEEMEQRRS